MNPNIYTLLCKRDLEMAKITLPKIIQFLSQDQKLIVIDDGSFSEENAHEVRSISPKITVILRSQREQLITTILSKHPNCLRYRESFPLAFKLLDVPLLAMNESPRFIFTDGDILYLKKCEAYFQRKENTYLITDGIKLSFTLRDGLFKYKWKIPLQFNSGYFSYHTDEFDLDFIEYYLGLPDVRKINWLSEQSCWALLFGRSKKRIDCPDINQFICRNPYKGPDETTFAIHLIGLKDKVVDWQDPVYKSGYEENDPIFNQARNVGKMDWIKKQFQRHISL
ncbi:MAG: hypothetical protein J7604_05710 [Sporocytophaga sp.]|uniref:hypothetical protein n=1 Tax=Sporocytophaga sp. TaxID=2231183 RepID=UPI001B084EFE|nr:hypothetical protein [Sporocytophaga sp.]MBO9699687.1 hypothetical protein [Sporocytophaga sp.]